MRAPSPRHKPQSLKPGGYLVMPAHLSDTLAERIRVAARRLPAIPGDVVEVLRGVFAHPTSSRDGDAA